MKYEGLDKVIRLRFQLQPKSLKFVSAKVASDALIFGPFDLLAFFTYMGLSAGKNVTQLKEDVKRDFVPAFVLGGAVWPLFQIANFRFVPVRYQLLYVNIFCLLDSAFLSWLEQQEDAPWKQWFTSFLALESKESQKGKREQFMAKCLKLVGLAEALIPPFFVKPVKIFTHGRWLYLPAEYDD
ncbi:hypothetical protein ACLOJK_020239 [Asimina triloba]